MIKVARIRGRDVEAHTPRPCPWCGHVLQRLVRTATDPTSAMSLCFYCEHPIRYVLGSNRIERVDLTFEPPNVRDEFERFIAVVREAKDAVRRGDYP